MLPYYTILHCPILHYTTLLAGVQAAFVPRERDTILHYTTLHYLQEYELPSSLASVMPSDLADGVRRLVQGVNLNATMVMRVSALGHSRKDDEGDDAADDDDAGSGGAEGTISIRYV